MKKIRSKVDWFSSIPKHQLFEEKVYKDIASDWKNRAIARRRVENGYLKPSGWWPDVCSCAIAV